MTKREALNGKPYAGNSHVWLDEEEYALAEPRSGFQLCLEKLHLKLTRSFAVIASVCLSLSVAIADEVNHYYVNPDPAVASDDYDGTRKVLEPGTNHGPKRTLKGAMEIAGLKAGDIVHAARGVYSEGVMDPINGETASNRVSVVAGVGIVADEGNLVTFIEGYVPPTTPESISTNGSSASVRCVAFRKNDKTGYLKGFTLRNGSAPIKSGTGSIKAYFGGGISYGTVIDCVISNCFAVRGGGAGQATLIRSRIADCGNVSGYNSEGGKASVQASASIYCSFYDSHIVGVSTFAQTSVNSTFEGSLAGDSSAKGNAYNCSISGSKDTGINYNSCSLDTPHTLDVYMRPVLTKVISKGNVEYYVYPAGFESEAGKDILGRPRLSKGKIDIGCYQYAPMTFYVDAVNGDDGWDGLAREHDGTEDSLRGPRKTLAASMKIDGLRSGDVVCALEGTYSEGLMYDSVTKATNRVVVAGGIGLISDKGPERTIIEGAPSVQEGGIGTDSVRGVFLNSRGAYIKGFTVRNGYTPAGVYGGGIYLYGNTAAIDCRIVNNKAGGRHGAASNGDDGVLIRCYVSGNSTSSDNTGKGAGNGSYFNCVFNGEGGKVYTQNGTAVNCLFLGKAQLMGKNSDKPTTSVYNCVFQGNSSPYRANLHRCIVLASDLAGSLRYEDGTLCTNDVSLVGYDDAYRPLPGSLAIDFGNSAYSASTADGGQFPAEWIAYADTDYSGGQRVFNGAIDAGAGEYDWRPDFGNVLGKGVSVTEASSMVSNDVENGRLALLPGKLSLEWSRKDIPVRTFTAGVEGGTGGALTILTNGAHFAEVASGHETFRLYVPQDDIEMSFNYDGDGCAYVSDMHCEAGFQFIVR